MEENSEGKVSKIRACAPSKSRYSKLKRAGSRIQRRADILKPASAATCSVVVVGRNSARKLLFQYFRDVRSEVRILSPQLFYHGPFQ